MIDFIEGTIVDKGFQSTEEAYWVIQSNGMGYKVLTTPQNLQASTLATTRIYQTLIVRETPCPLVGFLHRDERQCFELLIKASGVGVKSAIALLSALSVTDLTLAIMTGDHKRLTVAKGVGPKVAQRIALELKDKMQAWRKNPTRASETTADVFFAHDSNTPTQGVFEEVETVLMSLGYTGPEIYAPYKTAKPFLAATVTTIRRASTTCPSVVVTSNHVCPELNGRNTTAMNGFEDKLIYIWIAIRLVIVCGVLAAAVWFCRLPFMNPFWRPTAWSTLTLLIVSVVSVGLYFTIRTINGSEYGYSSIILAPIASGFILTWLMSMPSLQPGRQIPQWGWKRFFIDGFLAPTLVGLGHTILLFALLLEGSICIIMALPFILAFNALGGILAATILWILDWNKRKMLSCSLVLLAIAIVGQPLENHFLSRLEQYSQTSVIEINAPPEVVFQYVPGFPKIAANERNPRQDDVWFKLGLPEPQQSTVNCEGVGCERRCQFNQNIYFRERITAYEPGKLLRFNVISVVGTQSMITGVDPHILPGGIYFDNHQGEFRLTEVRPGVTRIEGTTWYHLQSSVNWYAKPYADLMLEAIHMRVLEHIKRVVESTPRPDNRTNLRKA